MPNYESLSRLLKLQGPSNVGALSNRGVDIATGMDEFAPTEGELEAQQIQEGDASAAKTGYGYSPSRDSIREDVMGALRRQLGLGNIAHQQKMAEAQAPEIIRGQAQIGAAQATAQAAEARAQANQDAMADRQNQMINALDHRQAAGFTHADTSREDTQAFKQGQGNPTANVAIGRERTALADSIAKQDTGIGHWWRGLTGQPGPRQNELDTFDSALGWAQKINREMPNASAEEGLAQFGQNADPNELGQVQKFLLMLRGH